MIKIKLEVLRLSFYYVFWYQPNLLAEKLGDLTRQSSYLQISYIKGKMEKIIILNQIY